MSSLSPATARNWVAVANTAEQLTRLDALVGGGVQ